MVRPSGGLAMLAQGFPRRNRATQALQWTFACRGGGFTRGWRVGSACARGFPCREWGTAHRPASAARLPPRRRRNVCLRARPRR